MNFGGSGMFIKKSVKKLTVFIMMFTMIFTSMNFAYLQKTYAADCTGKYTAPEKQVKTTVHGFTSTGSSSHFSITSISTAAFSDAKGSYGACNTIGKPSGGKTGGKVKACIEIGQKVANGDTDSATYKKYVWVMYYALHKGYLKEYSAKFVKVNRTLNYIRRGTYDHAQKGDYNRGYTESDYKTLISNAKTYYNNETGGPKANFYCWRWTNSDSDKQNFLTCRQKPASYNLKLIKSTTSLEDCLTNDYSYADIKYDVYKEDQTTYVGTLTCDETGVSNTIKDEITAGKYYAKEVATNSYFGFNSNWVGPVELTSSNRTGTFEAFDDPNLAYCSIQKKLDSSGNTNKPLSGFKFYLTYIQSEVEGGEDNDEAGTFDDEGSGSDEDSADYSGDENTYIKFEGTTGNDGTISSWKMIEPTKSAYYGTYLTRIPAGKYYVEENTTTSQFTNDECESVTNPFYITLSPGDSRTFTWTNKYPVELQMQIKKQTTDGGDVKGYKFRITGPSFPDGKEVATLTNGSSGTIYNDDYGQPLQEGTYTVEEVMTPDQAKRYKQPATQTVTLQNGVKEEATFTFTNIARTWDVKLLKDSTDGMVSNIDFKITGKTIYNKDIEKTVVSNDDGEILVEGLQPGEYVIEETGFDAENYINIKEVSGCSYPAIKFSVTGDEPEEQVIDLTNGGTNEDYIFENIRKPEITTSLVGESKEHIALYSDATILTDNVSYKNLKIGGQYTLKTSFHDPKTGERVGKQSSKEFTGQTVNGTEPVDVELDTRKSAGKSLVAFEELWYKGILIAEHKNLSDKEQTLVLPKVTTKATLANTNEDILRSGKFKIKDTLHNINLLADKKYIVKTYLVDKKTKKKIKGIQAVNTLITPAVDENATSISSEATSNASENATSENAALEASSSSIELEASEQPNIGVDKDCEIEIKGNITKAAGKTVVVYEEIYLNNVLVAKHTNIKDKNQTVKLPNIQSPKTGDSTKILLYILGFLAVLFILFFVNKKVKKA